MGRPRYAWWSYAREVVRRYPAGTQNETEAVKAAIDATVSLPNGDLRLEVIRLVFWARTRTLEGAAQDVHVSYETAKRWQKRFLTEFARNFKCDSLLSSASNKGDKSCKTIKE